MTQSKVLVPSDIYDVLSDDETFMENIGEYKFKGSSELQPAFSVVTPNRGIPNLEDVTGLEVLIHDVGFIDRKDYLTDPSDTLITYRIYLILWDGADGSKLTNASSRIVQSFSNAKTVKLVPVKNTENVMVQSFIDIPNNATILV